MMSSNENVSRRNVPDWVTLQASSIPAAFEHGSTIEWRCWHRHTGPGWLGKSVSFLSLFSYLALRTIPGFSFVCNAGYSYPAIIHSLPRAPSLYLFVFIFFTSPVENKKPSWPQVTLLPPGFDPVIERGRGISGTGLPISVLLEWKKISNCF